MLDFNPDAIDYASTKNPLYAWSRIHHCWKTGTTLPDWVMNYLGQAAEQLLNMKAKTGQHKTMIKNALGFQDSKCFSSYNRHPMDKTCSDIERARKIYERVNDEREKRERGNQGERIFEDVASEIFGDTNKFETVREIYYRWKKIVDNGFT